MLKECECRHCGILIETHDERGRPRRFANGHNRRKIKKIGIKNEFDIEKVCISDLVNDIKKRDNEIMRSQEIIKDLEVSRTLQESENKKLKREISELKIDNSLLLTEVDRAYQLIQELSDTLEEYHPEFNLEPQLKQ